MFEDLSIKIDKAIQTLKGKSSITDINVASTVKEIRKALIGADVHYNIAKELTDSIKEKAMGMDVISSISPGQLLVKITHDELIRLMGSEKSNLVLEGLPAIVLLAGLQGSGKTTFSGKLAQKIKRQGKSVMLAACDVYRPAAIEQLKILGRKIEVDVYADTTSNNPIDIAQAAVMHAQNNNVKVLIVDTAGRQAIDTKMMEEIVSLKHTLSPSETLFVADAMTGQDAVNTVQAFNEKIDFDGVVLTKMDSDARGGAALSIRKTTDKPIKFIGTGEGAEDIENFAPEQMANRILGMGDMVGFVEKAQQHFDQQEALRLNKKIKKNQFDLNDFLSQIQQIKKMGDLKSLIKMIPGANQAMQGKDLENDNTFKYIEAIIQSMTNEERTIPAKIDVSRKKRIANGSGTSIQQINQLLKQFEGMQKMMKRMNKMGNAKKALSTFNLTKG